MYHLFYLFLCLAPLAVCWIDTSQIESHPNWRYLDRNRCGFSRTNTMNRIIRGDRAALGQFPWIVRTGQQKGDQINYNCAGTLVNQHYVITAMHCGPRHWVRLGENDLATNPDCDHTGCAPPVQEIPIAETFFGDFDYVTFRNDIMLIRLAFPATYNDFVQPICLPYGSLLTRNLIGSYVQIPGWGSINPRQQVNPNLLMYHNAPIFGIDACRPFYAEALKPNPELQYCVGSIEGAMQGACYGDSGGPMTISENVNGVRRHFLVGIVSHGPKVCTDYPSVYTRVIHYLPQLLNLIRL
ncbi:unnamed protein product [Callosobruchus maculatus]|uniref:Peptidase S1 domain-containing protein n=1 Tax=Callosobruchus maculatus TaxID=64391 RepID=A0A653BH07_CALMS|nr:unnamed protein product [Callosobruchus maculatus]